MLFYLRYIIQVKLTTFQVLSSLIYLVATVLGSAVLYFCNIIVALCVTVYVYY